MKISTIVAVVALALGSTVAAAHDEEPSRLYVLDWNPHINHDPARAGLGFDWNPGFNGETRGTTLEVRPHLNPTRTAAPRSLFDFNPGLNYSDWTHGR